MMLETEHLRLRDWRESDLSGLQEMRNDAALQALLLSTAKGSSMEEVRNWVKGRTEGADNHLFVVVTRDSDNLIGYIQYARESGGTDAFRFGVCLSRAFQSQGYGSELMEWLGRYLKDQYSANKLILMVDKTNRHAIACYRKVAFREVGCMHRHVKVRGDWCDVIVMEKLLPEGRCQD
jgi:RimJ/RimL family protein N-acetyltransferase